LVSATAIGAPLPGPRQLPARSIPIPTTVSPVIQNAIAQPLEAQPAPPSAPAVIKKIMASVNAAQRTAVAALLKRYPAKVVAGKTGGVPTYLVTPSTLDPALRHRLLLSLHSGGYVAFAGVAGLTEAILVAHYTRTPVLSIDYRMPPDHPYPAAIDDTVAVWRQLLRTHDPHAMALFGTSAGGGLTLAAVQRFRALGLPLPAALFVGAPWADLARDDDTQFTNAGLDDVLGDGAALRVLARLYAGKRSLADPGVSPIRGDFRHFPPTILISGTRDLFLSTTVRTHRKLREAGVLAELNVFEALSHDEFVFEDTSPESAEAFGEVAAFFNRHLTAGS
jgi:acetyl esterase/lipase